jgi:hypothetical protein
MVLPKIPAVAGCDHRQQRGRYSALRPVGMVLPGAGRKTPQQKSPAAFSGAGLFLTGEPGTLNLVTLQRGNAMVNILDRIFAAAVNFIFQG